jgi:hypothetical protein
MPRDEAERYRQPAEDALGQLDWCIGYLHGIHRERISAPLTQNRAYIPGAQLRKASEPLPLPKTNQS